MYDPIVYLLETPKYHLLKIGAVNLFSGWVFNFGDREIDSLNVYIDGHLKNFPVNLPREDIAVYIPSIPAAKTCGFSFELEITSEINSLNFEILFTDKSTEAFFEFDIKKVIQQQEYFNELNNKLALIPQPEPELIYLTQGHYNVDEYKNSIIPGVMNLHKYLQHAGVNLQQIQSLLDFGCGSGRLLVGWHLLSPHIKLNGCDFNPKLLGWVQQNIFEQCIRNDLTPPLSYPDDKLDLIYLISVFTHLSLDVQKMWIQEFKRVLKIGGYILITLHGEIYVRNGFWQEPDKIQQFLESGFAESGSDDGSNFYASYHSLDFIKQMMSGFELIGYFPNGTIDNQRISFQTAQSQDVYIFRLVKV
ncbi:class I SAM-dependent methyltransferase [Candidatus Halobeggiatoa sp. HSG11]|nr:class I SAM-dependent methyltransferase [Candidatus Halobeggiatoa sp. HSG11]